MIAISDLNIPIVVIDDEPGILFLHDLILSEYNLSNKIFTFSNPKEGLSFILKTVDSNTPLVVILDINMPVLNGWEILDKLEKLEKKENIYVVMATSSIQKLDKEKSLMYKTVKMYVEKPLELEHCQQIKESISQYKWS